MFSVTDNKPTAMLGAVLFATFVASTSAWAGEAALAPNERAAQNTILETAQSHPRFTDKSATTLTHNEQAAQRIFLDFLDTTASMPAPAPLATSEAAVSHNEVAAQRAIADTPATQKVEVRRISASFDAPSRRLRADEGR